MRVLYSIYGVGVFLVVVGMILLLLAGLLAPLLLGIVWLLGYISFEATVVAILVWMAVVYLL